MNFKRINSFYQYILTFLIGCVAFGPASVSFVRADMPMPDMSEKQLRQLEEELAQMSPEELEAELLKEVEKLPEKEKEAFYETMDKISQVPEEVLDDFIQGKMSEEDLEKFLEEITPESMRTQDKVTEKSTPTKKTEKKPVKPEVKSKREKVIDMINAIITRTDSFTVKASALPDLPGKVKQWEKKKRIQWQPSLGWNAFKNELDKFMQKLHKTIEPEKKEYKYLDDLIENEALQNNLAKLEQVLSQYEPKIEEPSPFGLKKMDSKSKAALQKVIDQYNEAIYLLKIPQALDALFEKYEPKAKALREEEEKARKKAIEEAKKPRPTARPVTVGKEEEEDYGLGGYGAYDDYYGRPGYTPGYTPSRYAPGRPAGTPGSQPKRPGARPSNRGPVAKPTDKKAPAKVLTPEEKKKAEEEKRKAEKAFPRDPMASFLHTLARSFEHLDNKIKESKQLLDIKNYIVSKDDSKVKEVQDDIQHITKKINTIIDSTLDEMKSEMEMRKMTPEAKQGYQKKVENLFNKHRKTFDDLEKQIEAVQKEYPTLKAQISAEKKKHLFEADAKKTSVDMKKMREKIIASMTDDDQKKFAELFEQGKEQEAAKFFGEKAEAYLDTKMTKEEKEKLAQLKREGNQEKIEKMQEELFKEHLASKEKSAEEKGDLFNFLSAIKRLEEAIAGFAK